MGVYEEVIDTGGGDESFQAWAVAEIVIEDGGTPLGPMGAIGAFGKPHAARFDAESLVADVGAGGHLGADGLVVKQQRHVGVSGVGGEDLNVALTEAGGEFGWDVAFDAIEMAEAVGVPFFPLAGEVSHMGLIGFFEFAAVGGGAGDALVQVFDKSLLEAVMGELFEEDGGEADGEGGTGLVEGAFTDHVENREVGFGGGFVEPGFAVGIGPVVQDVREVAVEDQAKGTMESGMRGTSYPGGGKGPKR